MSGEPKSEATFVPDTRVKDLFVRWISRFDPWYLKHWKDNFRNDPEGAMCEAMYWSVLEGFGISVEPNDVDSGPDFLCRKNGQKFYVEVKCLTIAKVTKKATLPHLSQSDIGSRAYGNLNKAVFGEVRSKTAQCSNLDAPCLIAVGTFHYRASSLCFAKHLVEELLTGKSYITYRFDSQRGEAAGEGFLSSTLENAAFVKPGPSGWVEEARSPISAILLGGFGCQPPEVRGLLHPNPARPFDRSLLSQIEFGSLRLDPKQETLSVEWDKARS
jgi:hypothetical protein